MKPLITNERAEREWLWIVDRVGEQRVLEAITHLPGNRRPYPLYIARTLKLELPELSQLPQTLEKRDASPEVDIGLLAFLFMHATVMALLSHIQRDVTVKLVSALN